MVGDDAINPRQTKSPVLGPIFGCIKRFKNPPESVRGNAAAGILNLQTHIAAGGQSDIAILLRLAEIEIARPDDNLPAASERLDSIFEKFHEGLLQLGFLEHGRVQLGLELNSPNNVRIGWNLKKTDDTANQIVQIAGRLGSCILLLTT